MKIHFDEFNIQLSECGLDSKTITMTNDLNKIDCISCLNLIINSSKNLIFNLNELIEELDYKITIAHNRRLILKKVKQ